MNVFSELTLRQKAMLIIIEQHDAGIARELLAEYISKGFTASRATVIRDLAVLLKHNLVQAIGKGPSTRYIPRTAGELLRYYDMPHYFSVDPDNRELTSQSNEQFLEELNAYQLLFGEEQAQLNDVNARFNARLPMRDPAILKKEQERFTIELAWKSSRIEGNTYSLLETEDLIKTANEATGHSADEARMILNHKTALETISSERSSYKEITVEDVIRIHSILVSGLGIGEGIRKHAVGITGTAYLPPDSESELESKLRAALQIANRKLHPVEAAIVASALIAYLQPFADGNKRTARLVGNALLLAHDYAMLSYRSVDETLYKESVLLVDEQHSLYWYKQIFLEQFRFACDTYFR